MEFEMLSYEELTSTWAATDGLNRKISMNNETGNIRKDKYVGIFYHTWHMSFTSDNKNYNNTELLKKYPDLDKNNFDDPRWGSKPNKYHFWNEPIYGYYSNEDEWVVRRHAEILAAAGVDCVICDNTNGTFTWLEAALILMKVFEEARKDGVNAPQVVFMLPFFPGDWANQQLKELYENIYKPGKYQSSWFMWDGKPLIIAYPTENEEMKEINDFFTFRGSQPSYIEGQTCDKQWGWLSAYPQKTFRVKMGEGEVEQMTVGTAQNYDWKRIALTAMNGDNVAGRTYTSKGYDTSKDAVLYGPNFKEQFEYALEVDPKFLFITSYNEFVACRGKDFCGVPNGFADQFNDEYSRDVEPTKGILKDHYYYQMADYIRKFKGTGKAPETSGTCTIDINGDVKQWDNVLPHYKSYKGNTKNRDSLGYTDVETNKRIHYTDASGRNDLVDFKVARDSENIYFMARTADDITPCTGKNWMQLLISTYNSENTDGIKNGWESFNYILNKQTPKSESIAILEKFTGNGYETEEIGEVEYKTNKNIMTVKIPKSMLNICGESFTIDFKWTDNVQNPDDIMSFYTSGDVAPTGRFKYRYCV